MSDTDEDELRSLLADPQRWPDSRGADLLPSIRPQLHRRRRQRRAGQGLAAGAVAAVVLVGGVAVVGAIRHKPAATLAAGGSAQHDLAICELVLPKGHVVNQGLNADGGLVVPLVNRDGSDCVIPDHVTGSAQVAGQDASFHSPDHPVLGPAGPIAGTRLLEHGHRAVASVIFPNCSGACPGQHWTVGINGPTGTVLTTFPAFSSATPELTGLRVE